MKSRKPRLRSVDEKVARLIGTLVKTEQRLDKRAPGQVAVVGGSGARAPLLRGNGDQLRHNEATSQAAIRNALPAHIALLDNSGVILFVNGAWREFGGATALQGAGSGVGLNYLEICDRAREINSSEAPSVAEGIRSVLEGGKKSFSSEYPCPSLAGQRWFQLVVTPLHDDRLLGVVVMHLDISERKQVERSAQQNQKRLRDLIDGLGPSIFVGLMTPQGILIEVNRPALAAAGLEPQDLLGRPLADTYGWAHSPEVQQQLREAIVRAARGTVSRYDVQLRLAHGQLIDVDFSLQPVHDETGEVVFLVPSATVITERKRTEIALRESDQKFQALVTNITDAFWIRSPDMRDVHYISPAFERIWGRSVESLYACPHGWTDFIVPEDRERVLDTFATLTQEARSVDIEYRIVRPEGEIRWVRVRGFQVRNTSDQLIRLTGIVSDMTERHRVAEELQTSLEEFRALAEAMPQMVWTTEPGGRNVYFNRQWMDYTGLTLEESFAYGWNKPFHPDDRQRASDAGQHAKATKDAYTVECRLRRADGVYRWWLIRGVPLQDDTGMILKWFVTCTDIHDLKLIEEALSAEKESAQVRLNSIGDAVICTDVSGKINFLNSVAEQMMGCCFEDAVGLPMAEILQIKNATSGETTPNPMEMAVGQNRTAQLPSNCIFVRRDGIEIPIAGSVAPIHGRAGHATGAVIVVRDVSAARAMALQMVHLAEHDSLTGLPNRLLLNDRVSQAIALAPRHNKQVALLFLDLDGFKHINDSLGHLIGDKLLQSAGKRIVDCVRATDTVSRQGGDEFVVLLSEVEHPEDVATTARRILQAVAEPHSVDLHDLHVTTSIGLSVYPDDGLDPETLIKNADTAMYQAKENGRQSYQFFKPAMNVRAVERQATEESLRRALERQEFAVHYQPKVDLKTGKITGAEALIRWTRPDSGPISPAQFIPVAEDSGLILPIGNWVRREACKQARIWVDAGLPPVTIAVNVSAMEFRQETFLDDIFRILEETGVDPKLFELELTESVLMKRPESVASVLQELRTRGVRVAVDDFGTGYSSLSYLSKFPIDALKIDQSFVRQITTTPEDTSIVSAIIGMGRSMKLRVIAEGVETPQELAFLQDQQCHEAQGYLFSKPVPAQQFAVLLATGISNWCNLRP